MLRYALLAALLITGCAQVPQDPDYLRDATFQTLPDRSVIYVVRSSLDSRESSGLILDERVHFTSYPRSFYRWEVAPGTHRVEGFASASESVTLTTAPGGIYFLQHTVLGNPRDGVLHTALRQIGAPEGRALIARSYQRW